MRIPTKGDYVKHPRFQGVAMWVTENPMDGDDFVYARMVGDDQTFPLPLDGGLEVLDEDDFCGECGQIGCAANG